MWMTRAVLAFAALVFLAPANVFAEGPARLTWNRPVYPYKNLPGVTAPQMAEEKFKCWTRTAELGFGLHSFERAYPRLVYVCDQNGVISESTRPPNYSYWQYNDRNR
jgi:hypothetical protein